MTSLFTRKTAERRTPPPKKTSKARRGVAHPLDDALDDTFPASDPVAAQSPTVAGDIDDTAQKDPTHKKKHGMAGKA